MKAQHLQAGQALVKCLSPIRQYVDFNVQRQKIVTFDGVLEQYREFEPGAVKTSLTEDE
jgi:hypothetical protein